MAELSLFLYWKPCPDMEIENEKNFDPEILRKQGQHLESYLDEIADQLSILKENGWKYSGGLYDIMCYKDVSVEQAKEELKELDIDVPLENVRETPRE